jgi:Uma2 family endonuclease
MLDPSAVAPERLRPITRAEYEQMIELGLFVDERVELLHGMLVAMSPQGGRHSYALTKLLEVLFAATGARAVVRAQMPFAASDDSEPEPDVAVVPPGDYLDEHPRTALLLVEVADASLRKDRVIKSALYAACGVPEYWVVNLDDGSVEVYREPRAGRYTTMTTHRSGDELTLAELPDVRVPLAAILPPR